MTQNGGNSGHRDQIVWLEDWGFEPHIISLTPSEEKALENQFSHVVSDSINHTYNDPIPPPHSHTQELDTKAWIQWCVQRDFMERKQMLLEHSLGRSVRCCDVWRVILAQTVKNLPAVQETWVWSLGQEDPLEKGMAIHSSILAWRIPWAEESGSLWSRGSQRVRHDWVTNTLTSFTFFLKSKMLYLTSC